MLTLQQALPLVFAVLAPADEAANRSPAVVPTFECLGITWDPLDAAGDNVCSVQYRVAGSSEWKEGYPLYFDPVAIEYRGSLVHLSAATTYEIELSLSETGTSANVSGTTWSEHFPIATVVTLPEHSTTTLQITTSGTPQAWVLYTHAPGQSATIDVAGTSDYDVRIDAAYVVVRGLTLRNAAKHAISFGNLARDVVIENCDISGWGRVAEVGFGHGADGALHSTSESLERIVVQRNVIHHPRPDANSWAEERSDVEETSTGWHPRGPQAITWYNSAGNHVIRYNTVYSDDDHYYNDIFGGGSNCSFAGFPNRDSDIYGNAISHCWDDGIEVEGANRNVRVWGNYVEKTFLAIATRSTAMGPLYLWRNVYGSSRKSPLVRWDFDERGAIHKGGASINCEIEESDRGVYEFHNTILQLTEFGHVKPIGASSGPRGRMFETTTRNNVFHIADPSAPDKYSIRAALNPSMTRNDFDYDLFNGQLLNVPLDQETNGVFGVPAYSPEPRFDWNTGLGIFTLAPGSPGHDVGAVLPNFNDDFLGFAPDMGAHEAGMPPMQFGVNAYAVSMPVDAPEDSRHDLLLGQNRPNPFGSETRIDFVLGKDAHVNVTVFDVRGRLVKELVKGPRAEGSHAHVWDGRDRSGRSVAPGVYFYRLELDGQTSAVRKMVVGR